MDKTMKEVTLSVGSAVVVSLFCYGVWRLEGAVFGFTCTLLLIGLFKIWNMILNNKMLFEMEQSKCL